MKKPKDMEMGESGVDQPAHDEYKVKDAFETLMKAEEIKADKALMKQVHKHGAKKKKHIASIADLRKAFNESPDRSENEPQ
jgi:predicted RNA binding protein with dsRBD fold (UPF0201 family)